MTAQIKIGDRVALTANYLKIYVSGEHRYSYAQMRGEIIAFCGSTLAVVQWDGVPDELANQTYARGNLCKPRSVAFAEVRHGNADHGKGL